MKKYDVIPGFQEIFNSVSENRQHYPYKGKDLPLIIFVFLLFFALTLVFHFLNTCVTYAGLAFTMTTWLFVGIAGSMLICLFLYGTSVQFCTESQRENHILFSVGLICSVTSVLSWYDVYTITLNSLYIIPMFFMYGLSFIYFVIVFFEGHLRTCAEHNKHTQVRSGKITYGVYMFFFVLLMLAWLTCLFAFPLTSDYLYTEPNRPNNITCASY